MARGVELGGALHLALGGVNDGLELEGGEQGVAQRARGEVARPLAQKAKYKACEFGACPRTLCDKQTVLPVGLK